MLLVTVPSFAAPATGVSSSLLGEATESALPTDENREDEKEEGESAGRNEEQEGAEEPFFRTEERKRERKGGSLA